MWRDKEIGKTVRIVIEKEVVNLRIGKSKKVNLKIKLDCYGPSSGPVHLNVTRPP